MRRRGTVGMTPEMCACLYDSISGSRGTGVSSWRAPYPTPNHGLFTAGTVAPNRHCCSSSRGTVASVAVTVVCWLGGSRRANDLHFKERTFTTGASRECEPG